MRVSRASGAGPGGAHGVPAAQRSGPRERARKGGAVAFDEAQAAPSEAERVGTKSPR